MDYAQSAAHFVVGIAKRKMDKKQEIAKRQKERYEKNRVEVLEYVSSYYQKNKEKISEWKKQWYLKKRGIDSVIPHIKRTETEKKERLHDYNKRYYQEHKVAISEKRKAKYIKNKVGNLLPRRVLK